MRRLDCGAGVLSPAQLTSNKGKLEEQLAILEDRLADRDRSAVLRGVTGPKAAEKWATLEHRPEAGHRP